MQALLITIIDMTLARMNELREEIQKSAAKGEKYKSDLSEMINDILHKSVEICVFGFVNHNRTLTYDNLDGSSVELNIGYFLKRATGTIFKRVMNPLRQFTTIFDESVIGQEEKNSLKNNSKFKAYMLEIISQRKMELKDPNFKGSDFLSLIL